LEITVAGQWELFLYAGLLGVLLGAYYDVFRIIRYLPAPGKEGIVHGGGLLQLPRRMQLSRSHSSEYG